jgi:hypothetical protein
MRKTGIAAVALSALLSASAGAEDWTGVPIMTGSGFVRYDDHPVLGDTIVQMPNIPPSLDFVVQVGCNQVDVSAFGAPYNCPPSTYITGATFPISISQFARSGTVDGLQVQVSSIAASVASVSSTVSGLQGQVTTLSNRVELFEANVASLATVASVNALSGRVTSAEVQLASMQQDLTAIATYIPEAMQEMQKEARAGAAMAASLETVAPAPGSKNRLGFNSANYNGETAFSVSYVRQEGQFDVSAGVAMSGDEAMIKGGVGLSW